MIEIRRLRDGEMSAAVRLADDTFGRSGPYSMGRAFPHIFAEGMPHLSLGAFEDGKLAAFMGLVPWTIRIGEARVRVCSLGAVCTHPDARGRGIASAVLDEVFAYLRQADVPLLLVSGDRSLYTRRDCVPFGAVRTYSIDASAAARLARAGDRDWRLREMTPADLFAVADVAASRPVRYETGVAELGTLLKADAFVSSPELQSRAVVAERGDRVEAFAVIGLSAAAALPSRVIEHGGPAEAVARLIGWTATERGLDRLDLILPWQETGWDDLLAGVPCAAADNQGTIRVMDGPALVAQLRPWLTERDARLAERLELSPTADGGWRLSADGVAEPAELSARQLAALLFGCASEAPPPNAASAYAGVFPVPLPYTAGLHYV